ncbi:MAG: 50S ribosomal protein L5 [Anaerolineae bacterium]|nr:50S ribosomal protein L5 [Anaerolineae bacterium]
MQRLREEYRDKVVPELMKEFGYENVMQVPRIRKIVLNIGLGEALDNPKVLEFAVNDLRTITGQQPIVTHARRSIANFKLREGRAIGTKVTLRGDRMWAFLDRLVGVALPRTRDFRGVPDKLDGRGNYTLGVREQLLFPEVAYDSIDKIRGFEISINTSADTDEEARRLLEMLGMPFRH